MPAGTDGALQHLPESFDGMKVLAAIGGAA